LFLKGLQKINYECRKTIDAGSYLFLIILGELYESYHYRADFSFELQIIKVFLNNQVNLYEFFLLGS
jgi:hypothetical protein